MKTTGYKLQAAIREQQERRALNEKRWANGQSAWPKDVKKTPNPDKFMSEILDAEQKIAQLQTAQAQYNLKVEVTVQGEKMPLYQAVKLVGGAGRVESLWKEVAKNEPADRYGGGVRDKDSIVSVKLISADDATEEADKASKYARALREAIQTGNATVLDISLADGLTVD